MILTIIEDLTDGWQAFYVDGEKVFVNDSFLADSVENVNDLYRLFAKLKIEYEVVNRPLDDNWLRDVLEYDPANMPDRIEDVVFANLDVELATTP